MNRRLNLKSQTEVTCFWRQTHVSFMFYTASFNFFGIRVVSVPIIFSVVHLAAPKLKLGRAV